MSNSGADLLIYDLDDPLGAIKDQKVFIEVVRNHLSVLMRPYQLSAALSLPRLNEAYSYWIADLGRLGTHELDGSNPDHFKQAGHLSYWIRRTRPIIDMEVISIETRADLSPEDAYKDEYKLFFNYGNEYLAFELGFHLSNFYVLFDAKKPGKLVLPSWDLIECACHFLNAKNVSPHALFLIYKAFFDSLRNNS
jgi:hypothetical protein